ncbi:MAG: glycoside hydrolase family 2 [Phycisphaerae bacterium]|nr:glycoside hydrolase family 2 [Phycisphaerae bacterium]
MQNRISLAVLLTLALVASQFAGFVHAQPFNAQNIPLPEHPRPDFFRADWINLNGPWQFRFDKEDVGREESWFKSKSGFPETIMVPFPWGSKLSGVGDNADIAWYRRSVVIPPMWQGARVFIVIGASDWTTTAWLDGNLLGTYRGGYTPFEFDLTNHIAPGRHQNLVIRVDDTPHKFKLEGKQGYGAARGIWQTVYLEARPQYALDTVHFLPDIDEGKVVVKAAFNKPLRADAQLQIRFRNSELAGPVLTQPLNKGAANVQFDLRIPNQRLWTLDDPFLYDVDAMLVTPEGTDTVTTYFGMRKIGVGNLPGTDYPYVTLNNKPIYLQMSLDQAYHPDGFYTWPTDAFMRDEILRSRRLGLNAQRIHVKIDLPRKLYWADRLGMLIMADVPNSWGQPDEEMQAETEVALRGMIRRDFNHPSIFSWVIFNETWGLKTRDKGFTPETQKWVVLMYHLAKQLDPTRLVEDNSPCNNDHVATDLNTWHAYLPGYKWAEHLSQIVRDTHAGSEWNFIGGREQGLQPNLNSECGNVWGYEGSTGDVDYSWDYHRMMNEFRRHPKIAGWLYTEHHDVINEWNGYYRFDRSNKFTGLEELLDGMSLRDLHSPFYISTGQDISRDAKPGEIVKVPLTASFMTDAPVGPELILRTVLYGWDRLGQREAWDAKTRRIAYTPWMQKELEPLEIKMPDKTAVAVLGLVLTDSAGAVLHRNLTTFVVTQGPAPADETITAGGNQVRLLRFAPADFTEAKWSMKQTNVLDGLKVNGMGFGWFEYSIPWPKDLKPEDILEATIRFEASAKQLFGKDMDAAARQEGDFMRGKGTHDPSLNQNAYPMTDETVFPSQVRIRIADTAVALLDLPDDPADHRGILSWHNQLKDGKLREAGSYGWLVTAHISPEALQKAAKAGAIKVRLEVDDSLPNGLALYGERFGRYPLDPTLAFVMKNK